MPHTKNVFLYRRDSVGDRIEDELEQHIHDSSFNNVEVGNALDKPIYDSYPSSEASSVDYQTMRTLKRRDSVGDRIEQQLYEHVQHVKKDYTSPKKSWSVKIAAAPIQKLAKVLAVINATKKLEYIDYAMAMWLKTSVLKDNSRISCSIIDATDQFLKDHDIEMLLLAWNNSIP